MSFTFDLPMSRQTTSHIFMVRPTHFGFNHETASNNAFQVNDQRPLDEIRNLAVLEFDKLVKALRNSSVHVTVYQEDIHSKLTDSIFPNDTPPIRTKSPRAQIVVKRVGYVRNGHGRIQQSSESVVNEISVCLSTRSPVFLALLQLGGWLADVSYDILPPPFQPTLHTPFPGRKPRIIMNWGTDLAKTLAAMAGKF